MRVRPALLIGMVLSVAAWSSSPVLAATVTGIVVRTDRSVCCATYKTIVEDVTAGCKTDKDKALAVFNFVIRNVYIPYDYDRPKELGGGRPQTVYDPLKIINIYGAGGCGIQQVVFGSLLKAAGLEERALNPGFAHVSNEVKWDGKWHWLDTWLPLYVYDEKGDIYSYDELMADRALLTQAIQAGRTSRNFMFNPQDANGIVKAKGHNTGGSAGRPEKYVENLCLRPGESCTWMWDNVGKWCWPEEKFTASGPAFKFPADAQCKDAFPYWEPYKKSIKNGPHPWSDVYYRYYGNALFACAPPLTRQGLGDLDAKLTNIAFIEGGGVKLDKADAEGGVEIRYEFPYVVADSELALDVDLAKGGGVKLEYSIDDGKTWKEAGTVAESGQAKPVSIGKPNVVDPSGSASGQFRFALRLTLAPAKDGGPVLKSLKVNTVTMLNSSSRPWLETGKNNVTVACGGEALARTPLEITWRWLQDWTQEQSFTHKVAKSGQQALIEVGGTKRPKMKSVTIACPPGAGN